MTKEEAIDNVRSFIGQFTAECQESIRTLIPELAESEDERVRKALIDGIRQIRCKNSVTQEQMLAWLEKQKPAKWSEDYREEDIQTRFAFYTYKDDPSVLYLSNVFVEETSRNHGFGTRILKAAEKAAEAIGAITICLKVKQDSPANAWYRKRGYGYVAFEDGYDWLEKNLEYLKPAKSAEWSEEDLRHKSWILECLADGERKVPQYAEDFRAAYKWLKSLRSQPHWKPSEEQMEALENSTALTEKQGEALYSLVQDLKKL